MARLAPHRDRLLPAEPGVRAVARALYTTVRDLPIISPHGHVDPTILVDDRPFGNPASLLVTPDHYVTRLLHADGVGMETIGAGTDQPDDQASRTVWRSFGERWPLFRGTPVGSWLETQLTDIFGVADTPSGTSADAIYDQIAACLATDDFLPRAMFDRFRIQVLATTDDPADDLAAHAALAQDLTFVARVLPTFRPDRYLEPASPGWREAVARLGEVARTDVSTYAGYIEALEERRRYFVAHGATSADHSHIDVRTDPLEPREAARIYDAAMRGAGTEAEALAFRRHMLLEMARMSTEDGLVMTLHPGVLRNHHSETAARFGPDRGHDIPVAIEFTRSLRPLLERFGLHPNLHLVLFTVDETTFSREIAPLAGFYPSVYAGAPWWFLDAPDAIRRWRCAVTETIGFTRTSGFIDDTRAFCSIPARHDMARRLDAGHLAQLVAEHRLEEDEAHEVIRALVQDNPTKVFKL